MNFDDYSDELVTSWVRMAEGSISTRLRCKHQIEIVNAVINDNRSLLPDLWLELDFVRVVDGPVLEFVPRSVFFSDYPLDNTYTITGNYLQVHGAADSHPINVEISFYSAVPALNLVPTWLSLRYPELLTTATLAVSFAYSEDPRLDSFNEKMANMISAVNNEHILSKASGSTLVIRRKGLPF